MLVIKCVELVRGEHRSKIVILDHNKRLVCDENFQRRNRFGQIFDVCKNVGERYHIRVTALCQQLLRTFSREVVIDNGMTGGSGLYPGSGRFDSARFRARLAKEIQQRPIVAADVAYQQPLQISKLVHTLFDQMFHTLQNILRKTRPVVILFGKQCFLSNIIALMSRQTLLTKRNLNRIFHRDAGIADRNQIIAQWL